MKKVNIVFEFEEKTEDDYTYHDLVAVSLGDSDLDAEALGSQAESLAQSDHYWVDTCNAIIRVLDGDRRVEV